MKNLAELVLDWAKADDAISHDGWDGGELEAWLDNTKEAMVSAAEEIVSGKKAVVCTSEETVSEKKDCELRELVLRTIGDSENIGISMMKRPSLRNDSAPVVAKVRLICKGGDGKMKNAHIPFELTFTELCAMLCVISGISETAIIASGMDPGLVRTLTVAHEDGDYVFRVDLDGCGAYCDHAYARVGHQEAYVIARSIEGALPHVIFGL